VCNSPEVAHYGLWEQNIWGVPDRNGISIRTTNSRAYMTNGGVPYELWVEGGRLYGRNKAAGYISGMALIGSTIELMHEGAPYYDITITGVRTAGSAFIAGDPGSVETYKMVWHEPGTSSNSGKALCESQLAPTSDAKTYDLHGMLPDETLLFEGDRYDIETMTTEQGGDDAWFNFGCAGHTLAKLYLSRNTIRTQPVPDWKQRQTTLKMFVADYCGGGTPMTLAGEPLVWKGGLTTDYPHGIALASLDARWFEGGATCLGEPRMKISSNPQAPTQFPAPVTQIFKECDRVGRTLPFCTNADYHDMDGTTLVSANPQ
jgi:hypothetical protein